MNPQKLELNRNVHIFSIHLKQVPVTPVTVTPVTFFMKKSLYKIVVRVTIKILLLILITSLKYIIKYNCITFLYLSLVIKWVTPVTLTKSFT